MELSVNAKLCFFLLCFLSLDIGNFNSKETNIVTAANDKQYVYILASFGKLKELTCRSKAKSNERIRSVSWYRTTDNDTRKCPHDTYSLNNDSEVFCDRLTNDRSVQNSFKNRFSVNSVVNESESVLIITRVELSDVGVYACADESDNILQIRALINITVEDVGSKKKLVCPSQTSSRSQPVAWYRATNDDARRCPDKAYVSDGGSSVFCDHLTNNRIVQLGFRQRFSVPLFRTENENGLIITKVELSDAGIYACKELTSNKILAGINLTVDEGRSQSDGGQTTHGRTQDITTEKAAMTSTSKPLVAVSVATTIEASTSVATMIEASNTSIIIVIVTGFVGFIAGLIVATALLKRRDKCAGRSGNMTPDPIPSTNGVVGMLPEDVVSDRPAADDKYSSLNTIDITPSSVYSELSPPDADYSMPSNENATALEMPLYEHIILSMRLLSSAEEIDSVSIENEQQGNSDYLEIILPED